MKYKKSIFLLFLSFLLAACISKDPANQCLDSFRASLKNPDSGKVFDFTEDILTYTATNSYGARIQGKALCMKSGIDEKWQRNRSGEYIIILQLTANKLEKSNNCMKAGGKAIECAGDSKVLQRQAIYRTSFLDKELQEEVAQELGFR